MSRRPSTASPSSSAALFLLSVLLFDSFDRCRGYGCVWSPAPRGRDCRRPSFFRSTTIAGGGGKPLAASAAAREEEEDRLTSILDDGKGHIRGDLAQSLWEWDRTHHRSSDDDEKPAARSGGVRYSTRSGLRLVDSVARSVLSAVNDGASSTSTDSHGVADDSASISYNDLVQEGVMSLMRSMASYDDEGEGGDSEGSGGESFEKYAKKRIRHDMSRALSESGRPIRLPNAVHESLRRADVARDELREANEGIEPTIEDIAARSGLTVEKLRLYKLVGGGTLSVEGTVEVYDPNNPDSELSASFEDEDAYETEHGVSEALLHSGEDEFVEEEEEWVEPKSKIVAPLRDFVVDETEPSPDDLALIDMLREDVNDFLDRTLDDREREVIVLRYGLEDGVGLTLEETGERLGISLQRVYQIEGRALDKLRTARTDDHVDSYLEEEHESTEED